MVYVKLLQCFEVTTSIITLWPCLLIHNSHFTTLRTYVNELSRLVKFVFGHKFPPKTHYSQTVDFNEADNNEVEFKVRLKVSTSTQAVQWNLKELPSQV